WVKEIKEVKGITKTQISKSKDKRKRRENSESTSSRPIALLLEVGSSISIAIAEPSYTSKVLRDQQFDQLMEKIKGIDEYLKEVEDKISENWNQMVKGASKALLKY
ncbi:22719_t:CDS:2, partial [Gigaspora margarita]